MAIVGGLVCLVAVLISTRFTFEVLSMLGRLRVEHLNCPLLGRALCVFGPERFRSLLKDPGLAALRKERGLTQQQLVPPVSTSFRSAGTRPRPLCRN